MFVERVGLLAEGGLPRSVARVFGWLVVCEPPHQSAEQMRATLKLSAGAVSAATATLVRAGIVTRVTFPGDRRTYHQLRPDGWQRLLRSRLQLLAQARQVAEQALEAAGDQGHERLRDMRDFYARCETLFARLLDEPADAAGTPRGPGSFCAAPGGGPAGPRGRAPDAARRPPDTRPHRRRPSSGRPRPPPEATLRAVGAGRRVA